MHSVPANTPSANGRRCTEAHARAWSRVHARSMSSARSARTALPGSRSVKRPAPEGTSSQRPLAKGSTSLARCSRRRIAATSRACVRGPEPCANRSSR